MKTQRSKRILTDFVLILDRKETQRMKDIVESCIKNLPATKESATLLASFHTELGIYLKEENHETSDDE